MVDAPRHARPAGEDPPWWFSVTPKARQMAAIVRRDESDGVWRCRYCRIELTQVDQPHGWHEKPFPERDHVMPRVRGGSNALTNLVLACAGCNVRKGSKLLDELPADWHTWRERVTTRPPMGVF